MSKVSNYNEVGSSRVFLTILLVLSVDLTVPSGQAEDIRSCLARANASDAAAFLAFDRELRSALSADDTNLLTLLTAYPLRLNEGGGTTWIDDPRALMLKAASLFTPRLRSAVRETKLTDLICTDAGIAYGRGELWVVVNEQFGVERFAIGVINAPMDSKTEIKGAVFVCRADDFRILIDHSSTGALRYRSWNRPRSATEKPDLEVVNGVADFEGRGPCARRFWTFKNGPAVYEVGELRCLAENPPRGVIGELRVLVDDIEKKQSWCY